MYVSLILVTIMVSYNLFTHQLQYRVLDLIDICYMVTKSVLTVHFTTVITKEVYGCQVDFLNFDVLKYFAILWWNHCNFEVFWLSLSADMASPRTRRKLNHIRTIDENNVSKINEKSVSQKFKLSDVVTFVVIFG